MARLNRPESCTHEGGLAAILSAEEALRRTVLASHEWENRFDQDGATQDGATVQRRVAALVPQVEATAVAARL